MHLNKVFLKRPYLNKSEPGYLFLCILFIIFISSFIKSISLYTSEIRFVTIFISSQSKIILCITSRYSLSFGRFPLSNNFFCIRPSRINSSKYLEGTRCFISLFKLAVLIYSEIVSPSFFARRLISLATLLFTQRVITLVLCRTSEPLRLFLAIAMTLHFARLGCRGLP